MLGNRFALLVALVLFFATLGLAVTVSRAACDGAYAYPADDAYIHLGIAKHLAEDRVWGIDASGFAGASSSPGWAILLALVGAKLWAPLFWATAGTVAVLVATSSALRELPAFAQLVALVAQVVLVPLASITVLGMEHTLHAALAIAALALGTDLILRPQHRGPLLAVLVIAGTIRYESLFLAFAIAAALAVQRRWVDVGGVAAAALAGPVVYAMGSLSRGWYAIPNTLVLKTMLRTSADPMANGVERAGHQLLSHPDMAVAVGVACLLGAGLESGPARVRAKLFAVAALLHLVFARIGMYGRYEAYLVAMAIVVLAPPIAARSSRLMLIVGGALVSLPLVSRARGVALSLEPNQRIVCRDQLPVARFLASEFAGGTVAVAEIGAVSWLAQERVIDLLGLGNLDVAKHIRDGTYGAQAIDDIAGGADVVAVFNSVNVVVPEFAVPGNWTDLGYLADPDLLAYGSELHFYAPRSDKVPRLREALDRFPLVPPTELRLTQGFEFRGADFTFTGGPAQEIASGGLGFYGNGRAQLKVPAAGRVMVRLSGTPGGGRQPQLGVICGDTRYDVEAPATPEEKAVCTLDGKSPLVLSYDDDFSDGVQDRNVEVERVYVELGAAQP